MKEYRDLNDVEDFGVPFALIPKNFSKKRYGERTDRNIGWISKREQELLRFATVGIAGCGGMGGLLAATLVRAGVGHIKIADLEVFDASNLNRQFAARQHSIGLPKVIETARMLREIAEDTTIEVFPNGICEESIPMFSSGCGVIADEIEFWAVHARLLLHESISRGTTILNGNSVGMGTRIFKFKNRSAWKMSDILRMTVEEAKDLETKLRMKTATREEVLRVQESVLKGLVPEIPEYMRDAKKLSNVSEVRRRLFDEGKAPILATNPPMATGFLANHIVLELLHQKSSLRRKVVYPPDMPGYLYFDAALMQAKIHQTIWWTK